MSLYGCRAGAGEQPGAESGDQEGEFGQAVDRQQLWLLAGPWLKLPPSRTDTVLKKLL